MNYNHDTDMDLDWAADQLRRRKLLGSGLPDAPIRRVTTLLPQATLSPRSDGSALALVLGAGDATLGNALSALAINARDGAHCAHVCRDILALLADRDRVALHAEFAQLHGVEAVLGVLREHHAGDTALVALRILDKLSRTSAREICSSGGIEVVVRCCDTHRQGPQVIATALRVLHGLTFDNDAKLLLLRRGVHELAEAIAEARPAPGHPEAVVTVPLDEHVQAAEDAWLDVLSIGTRLLQRMGGPKKGGSRRLPV